MRTFVLFAVALAVSPARAMAGNALDASYEASSLVLGSQPGAPCQEQVPPSVLNQLRDPYVRSAIGLLPRFTDAYIEQHGGVEMMLALLERQVAEDDAWIQEEERNQAALAGQNALILFEDRRKALQMMVDNRLIHRAQLDLIRCRRGAPRSAAGPDRGCGDNVWQGIDLGPSAATLPLSLRNSAGLNRDAYSACVKGAVDALRRPPDPNRTRLSKSIDAAQQTLDLLIRNRERNQPRVPPAYTPGRDGAVIPVTPGSPRPPIDEAAATAIREAMSTDLRDVLAISAGETSDDHLKFEAAKNLLPAIGESVDALESSLDRLSAEAARTLDSKTMSRYAMSVETIKAVTAGWGKIIRYLDYASAVPTVIESEGAERADAIGELVWQAAKDLASTGFEKTGPLLVGPRWTATLGGALPWLQLPGILLDAEVTGREPAEIIRDERTSLGEKQAAAASLYRQFQRHGASWQPAQVEEMNRLLELSAIVVREAQRTGPEIRPR
jgi:hypothetical protein